MKYMIITGQSGAGKTACVRYLEDKGCFCMDNIPPMMIPKLMEAFDATVTRYQTVAVGVDVRSGEFFDAQAVAQMLRELVQLGHTVEVVFMEASDETLLNRYKETRREHPLCQEGLNLTEAIAEERNRLMPLRETANYVIDTTGLNSRAVKKILSEILGGGEGEAPLRVDVMSFGFKRGLPRQADMVLDVRFLPNPFYVASLKGLTGKNKKVKEYVLANPEAKKFAGRITGLILDLISSYAREGKYHLTVAIGCTGGRHRSVVMAEEIASRLEENGRHATLKHRDA